MNGALNFTLGLQANQFLNSLGIASGKLIGFLGVVNGIQAAFGKMWAAVQQGGKLTDLAASASLTVKDLYQLQQAFINVGASADAVPSIINRLRRTLAGGEQDGLLAQLGLDPAALAGMNPAAQFESVAAALAKIDVNARANAAQQIFGREGAATIQQIANSGNDFASAMQRASADAQTWQNVSGAFDAIADKVTEVQAHIQTLWAQLAGALIQAFNEGQLTEVITDIIVTGFQAGLAVVPAMFAKLGEILLRTFETPLLYLQAGIEYAIDQAVNNPTVRKLLQLSVGGAAVVAGLDAAGITSSQPSTFAEILAARREEGLKFNLGSEFGMGDISDAANSFLNESLGKAGDILGGLSERLGSLAGRLPPGSSGAAGTGAVDFEKSKGMKTDVTDIEKMGGVLLGLGRGFGGDEARQTANNTRRTADLLVKTNDLLTQQSQANYANI